MEFLMFSYHNMSKTPFTSLTMGAAEACASSMWALKDASLQVPGQPGLLSELLCQQNRKTGRRGEGLEGEEIGGWNSGEKGGEVGRGERKSQAGGLHFWNPSSCGGWGGALLFVSWHRPTGAGQLRRTLNFTLTLPPPKCPRAGLTNKGYHQGFA